MVEQKSHRTWFRSFRFIQVGGRRAPCRNPHQPSRKESLVFGAMYLKNPHSRCSRLRGNASKSWKPRGIRTSISFVLELVRHIHDTMSVLGVPCSYQVVNTKQSACATLRSISVVIDVIGVCSLRHSACCCNSWNCDTMMGIRATKERECNSSSFGGITIHRENLVNAYTTMTFGHWNMIYTRYTLVLLGAHHESRGETISPRDERIEHTR